MTSKYALFWAMGALARAPPVPHIRRPFFTMTTSLPVEEKGRVKDGKYYKESKQSPKSSTDNTIGLWHYIWIYARVPCGQIQGTRRKPFYYMPYVSHPTKHPHDPHPLPNPPKSDPTPSKKIVKKNIFSRFFLQIRQF